MSAGIPLFVIAGTGSGVGKTSITLGIVAALKRRGLKVQTFKVGPDYLDPTHLARASGRPCYNLDGWMTSREYVEQLVAERTRDANVAIVEGVMGLYDGANPSDLSGSTAEIAKWLGAPVILVVNAHGAARSLAAVVHGFATFREAPQFAGVIANHSGSSRHVDLIRQALASEGLPPLVGAVPRDGLSRLSSRHLGLTTATEQTLDEAMLSQLADACERHIDLPALRSLKWLAGNCVGGRMCSAASVRVGLAFDEAFHFYYRDGLESLAHAGVEWVMFSPVNDRVLPEGLDAVWLGGGYPEEYAEKLNANETMRRSVSEFAAAGRPVYAECGGLMYLAESVIDRSGKSWAMTGVIPVGIRMLPKLKRLGYASVELREECSWGLAGEKLRGHEFHYSELESVTLPAGWRAAYSVTYRDGTAKPEGFWNGSVLASYVHVHPASNPALVESFVTFLKGRQAS